MSGPNERTLGDPARGTRPANRRQMILRAAADLFYENGYAKVGMGDVAEAVSIGPSALYRHFRGKQDLLVTVVDEALETMQSVLRTATAADLPTIIAVATLQHRRVGVLVRRESRQLPEDDRTSIRVSTKRIGARFAELITERRPGLAPAEADLLAWSALATANSFSFHSLSLPEPASIALIGELITAVVDAPIVLPTTPADHTAHAGLTRQSRREAILAEATRLFARNGFAGVSMEEIGAGVGISGPSVYNHFPAKSDILMAAVFRGDEWLQMEMNRAFARAADPRDGMLRLLHSYGAFAFENPDLIQLLISESMHLPESERHRARSTQHAYIAEWVHLLIQVHPGLDAVTARIRVQAAQTVMNDIAVMPHLQAQPGIDTALLELGARLLGLAGDEPGNAPAAQANRDQSTSAGMRS
ncbi:TetR/AcrR family transcriptional regulator [Nocardia sp. NBC_01388]|uniref:TetR/AcrR family transcriptional regulator n=1 Tax=Nocardia sp. NBC_01388 TaxID=2903596 RepID=UPI003247D15E